jgi:hypothetical protein
MSWNDFVRNFSVSSYRQEYFLKQKFSKRNTWAFFDLNYTLHTVACICSNPDIYMRNSMLVVLLIYSCKINTNIQWHESALHPATLKTSQNKRQENTGGVNVSKTAVLLLEYALYVVKTQPLCSEPRQAPGQSWSSNLNKTCCCHSVPTGVV